MKAFAKLRRHLKPNSAQSAGDPSQEYALISYEGSFYDNIGDEIQSIAALRFLPRVDYLIPIDKIHEFRSPNKKKVKIILNGYYTCVPDAWPPSRDLDPLIISFHLTDVPYPGAPAIGPKHGLAAADVLLEGEGLEFFRSASSVGCRDMRTAQRLRRAGVRSSFFSGCLTLTLDSKWAYRSGQTLIVDVDCDPDFIVRALPRPYKTTARKVTHDLQNPTELGPEARFAKAQELLAMYATAECVLTSRLHCALPCLALGTPVLFVTPRHDLSRFAGLTDLLNCISVEELSRGLDWSLPPQNPRKHLALRAALEQACRNFLAS